MPILVSDAAARPGSVLRGHDGVDHDVSRRLPDFRAAIFGTRPLDPNLPKQGKEAPSLSDCVKIRVREKNKRAGSAAASSQQMLHQRLRLRAAP